MEMPIQWRWYRWPELDADTLYRFLKLRSDIFVVEQQCPYSDMDGLDPQCLHLCGYDREDRLIGYLRLLPPGLKQSDPALGRLVVNPHDRGTGVGRRVMQEGLRACAEHYPGAAVFLSGQQHLQGFYASLGFQPVSAVYLEDGIPHVDMRRPASD